MRLESNSNAKLEENSNKFTRMAPKLDFAFSGSSCLLQKKKIQDHMLILHHSAE